jgi:hypothetical protein
MNAVDTNILLYSLDADEPESGPNRSNLSTTSPSVLNLRISSGRFSVRRFSNFDHGKVKTGFPKQNSLSSSTLLEVYSH